MTNKKPAEITPELEKALVQGKDILASKQSVLMEIGRLQALTHVKNYSTVAVITIFKRIRESKDYKGLTYEKDGKTATVTTIEEFCPIFLGKSYRSLKEAEDYLDTFGEEFYESSKQIGIGNREMRALRQLPDDEQALVIESEAVEVGDKEAVKDLIEELKAKHKKETATLKEELHASDAMLRANRELSSKNAVEMQNIKEQLHQKKFSPNKWQNDVRDFFTSLHKVHNQMHESLNQVMCLHEQLQFVDMDDRAKDACIAAFYADNKLLVEQVALSWNTIENHWGHFQASAKPSGEFLAELGFDNAGDL